MLRGQNSHAVPAVFKKLSFSDRDIRARLRVKCARYILSSPWELLVSIPNLIFILLPFRPYLSFVLFTATVSSPTLMILQDVNNIENDLKSAAARYLSLTIRCDRYGCVVNHGKINN